MGEELLPEGALAFSGFPAAERSASGGHGPSAPGFGVTGRISVGAPQDASLRQQERIPDRGGHGRGNHPRNHGPGRKGTGGLSADGSGGDPFRFHRRVVLSHGLQRSRPPLLFEAQQSCGGHPGEPGSQRAAGATEPRDRVAVASGPSGDRRKARSGSESGGDAAGSPGHRHPDGRGVRHRRQNLRGAGGCGGPGAACHEARAQCGGCGRHGGGCPRPAGFRHRPGEERSSRCHARADHADPPAGPGRGFGGYGAPSTRTPAPSRQPRAASCGTIRGPRNCPGSPSKRRQAVWWNWASWVGS